MAADAQFGLDPHMLGFQQFFVLQSAGMVDYVPHQGGIDYSTARESDEAAAKAWK
jgi:hypothetical protein